MFFRGNLWVDCRNNIIRKIEASAVSPVEEDRNKGLRILENDLKKLLHMTELCDFSIKIKDREFGVHKPLLKARCPSIFSLLTGIKQGKIICLYCFCRGKCIIRGIRWRFF